MLGFVLLYAIGCIAMFALVAFPPTENGRLYQAEISKHFVGRRAYEFALVLLIALFWPITFVMMLLEAANNVEWYE